MNLKQINVLLQNLQSKDPMKFKKIILMLFLVSYNRHTYPVIALPLALVPVKAFILKIYAWKIAIAVAKTGTTFALPVGKVIVGGGTVVAGAGVAYGTRYFWDKARQSLYPDAKQKLDALNIEKAEFKADYVLKNATLKQKLSQLQQDAAQHTATIIQEAKMVQQKFAEYCIQYNIDVNADNLPTEGLRLRNEMLVYLYL